MEQDGIVFIDEIDKIVVSADLRYGARPLHMAALKAWQAPAQWILRGPTQTFPGLGALHNSETAVDFSRDLEA